MKPLVCVDIEVLPNYVLVAFKGLNHNKLITIDCYGSMSKFTKEQRGRLNRILTKNITFGFNSLNYDMVILNYIIQMNVPIRTVFALSKAIVEKGKPHWMSYKDLDLIPNKSYDHIDVQEPSPAVMISLKNYGTRVGSKKLQEFYLDPYRPISEEEVQGLKDYCENDLDVTIDLYKAIEGRIELRQQMSADYGLDLRSKSDAQIAEAVIVKELGGVDRPSTNIKGVGYRAPRYISFERPELQRLVDMLQVTTFDIADNGQVKLPKHLSNYKIVIGNTTYKLGIGGLHSQEKAMSVVSNKTHVMRNADFTSYYPFIILNNGFSPKHLGNKFLSVYRKIVERRLKAKAEGDKLVADSLKIVINGSFGKFGSKYSKLYSPELMLATTLTGQLTLLMLIEQLEKHGIPVVSANTDGLEYFCPRDKIELAEAIIFDLELVSGYEMEHSEYYALHSANVNNYVAVYDSYTKCKGLYAETTLSKGRSTPIVYEAIREYLLNGTPIQKTITNCTDVNQFVSARTVKGGGVYDEKYLGKMVRWYYSLESKGYISYKTNGNKVPKTDGAKPMMNLTDGLPSDLNFIWYYNEAIDKLKDLGVEYVE